MRKFSLSFFLIYLAILPLIDQLNYKIYGKIGVDNVLLFLLFWMSLLSLILDRDSVFLKKNIFYDKFKNISFFFYALISLYGLAFFFPTYSSLLFGKNLSPYQLTMGLRFVQMIFVLIMLNILIEDFSDLKYCVIAYFTGAAIAALFGIGQAFRIKWFWDIANDYYLIGKAHLSVYRLKIKICSFWPESGNTFGSFMTMSILLLFGSGRIFLRKKILLAFFFLIGLLISLSFTSIISLIAASLILWTVSSISEFSKKYSLAIVNSSFLILILIIGLSILFSDRIEKRTNSYMRYSVDNPFLIRGLDRRTLSWRGFWNNINTRNVLETVIGKGYAFSSTADNYYIELLAAGGFLSLLLFIVILLVFLFSSYNYCLAFQKSGSELYFIFRVILGCGVAISVMMFTGSYFSYLPTVMPLLMLSVGVKKCRY
ncbi:hypothetical protein KA977_07320 [Candidatus Dependentiae bacterium]|nr:hypothetical protein [Candidatus Dependentiae bacterium]